MKHKIIELILVFVVIIFAVIFVNAFVPIFEFNS